MAAADSTTYLGALKRLYPQNDIERAVYGECPLVAMMPKRTDLYGEAEHVAIRFGNTSGRSATFANAKANKGSSPIDKWLITTASDYSLFSITGRLIRQSQNKKGAIVDALQEEMDSAMDAMGRSFAKGAYGNGGGAIGRISSGSNVATATITLASLADNTVNDANTVVHFEKGQVLNLAATDGTTGTVRVGQVSVKSVDRDAGTVTINEASWSTITGASTGDFIFIDGDFNAKMKGLDAWLPGTAPTNGDNFFGMDRSQDANRLAGVRVDGTGLQIEEAIKKFLQRLYRNGAKVTHIFLNDANFLDLDLSMGSRKEYADSKMGEVGYTGIKFNAPGMKPVEIYPDFNCTFNVGYGLTMPDWSIRGPGNFPFIDDRDGNDRILREDAADAFEGRIVSYHQMVCTNPSRSGRLKLG